MCYSCAVWIVWAAGILPAGIAVAVGRGVVVRRYARLYDCTRLQARADLQAAANHHGTSMGMVSAVMTVMWPISLLLLLLRTAQP